ncbi:MAG: hypothetical protein JJE04_20290 [Acidobacteriia bacterium]|nr:hypothetical protein [Terriglobia bacterium]
MRAVIAGAKPLLADLAIVCLDAACAGPTSSPRVLLLVQAVIPNLVYVEADSGDHLLEGPFSGARNSRRFLFAGFIFDWRGSEGAVDWARSLSAVIAAHSPSHVRYGTVFRICAELAQESD